MSSCFVRFFIAGCFSLLIVSCGGGGAGTGGGGGGGSIPFSISVTPASLLIVPNSTFTVTVKASGGAGAVTLSAPTLPAGITSTTAFPLTLNGGTGSVTFQAASTLAIGNFTLTLNGQSGTSNAALNIPVTVQSVVNGFFFPTPLFREAGVGIGGSGQFVVSTISNVPAVDYDIALSLSGLPAGVSATLTPPTILPGQSSTIVFSAAVGAPISRNVTITVTGTPKAPVASASTSFLLDVTQPPGSVPNNQTSYLSLEGNPNSAVYDPLHKLIFASNPSWNRVDVISATTRKIIKSVPVPDSRSVDITQDRSRVWVGTGGHQIYEISTTTFSPIRHPLPDVVVSGIHAPWEDFQVLALADGTVMLEVIPQGLGIPTAMVWDPVSNTVTSLSNPVPGGFGLMQRTGDGKRVYCFPADSGGMALFYDVIAKTFSTPVNIGGQPFTGAVNFDGSRVLAGLAMFDGNFNFLGNVPGGGFGGPSFSGGTIFSEATGILYEVSMPGFTPLILAIDPNTLNLIATAPALPMIPAGAILSPPFFMGIPFAVDGSGIVFETQQYGIVFDDSTDAITLSPLTPGTPTFLQHMSPQVGPLAGGTTSGGFGNAFSLTPDVWYGANRGTASISGGTLSITSPPGTPGPVDIKFIFPNGIEVYDPLFFSYGPFAQYSIQSGAAPTGGSTGQIGGYGLPTNSSSGSITVAGSPATITGSSARIGSVSFGGYPFPAGTVNFTVPAGAPGFAAITVNTPAGTSTIPKGIFYAQSVTDFASADSFNAILYDSGRQQLYLSAGDHIDVFSLSAGHFVTPFTAPSQSGQKRFAGMALSPDGSTLFATDLNDGSLAVINPDNPATSSFIPVAPVDTSTGCPRGPLYVASAINNHVYVVTGGLPAIGCGPGGNLFQIDTVAQTSTAFNDVKCGPNPLSFRGAFVASSHSGTKIAFSNCIYDETAAIFSGFRFNFLNEQTIAGDGNVAAGLSDIGRPAFSDMTGNIISRVALGDPYYGSVFAGASPPPERQEPLLNDSGSLLFKSWPQFFDIVDVQHGTLAMRFSLAQTILDAGVPMAIDSGGRHIYLITDRGLTIVDLGSAVLSVGSLTPASAAPGTQITVRGSGFDLSTSATLGSQAATVTLVDENTLTLTVPTLTSGPADLLLTKSGGLSYRLENAVNIP